MKMAKQGRKIQQSDENKINIKPTTKNLQHLIKVVYSFRSVLVEISFFHGIIIFPGYFSVFPGVFQVPNDFQCFWKFSRFFQVVGTLCILEFC